MSSQTDHILRHFCPSPMRKKNLRALHSHFFAIFPGLVLRGSLRMFIGRASQDLRVPARGCWQRVAWRWENDENPPWKGMGF